MGNCAGSSSRWRAVPKRYYQAHDEGRKEGLEAEMMEALGIATLVGGTIVIPHLRRAYEFWEELEDGS